MLSLLEVGGFVLERVATGSSFSLVLVASACVLSLGYLLRLGSRRQPWPGEGVGRGAEERDLQGAG